MGLNAKSALARYLAAPLGRERSEALELRFDELVQLPPFRGRRKALPAEASTAGDRKSKLDQLIEGRAAGGGRHEGRILGDVSQGPQRRSLIDR